MPRKRPTNVGDIDAIYNALRPRLDKLRGGAVVAAPPTGVGPHTHTAAQITYDPAGFIASEDCQLSQEELDAEKLARSGEQEMLGDLPMAHHSINDIHDADIEGTAIVGEDIVMTGPPGSANVTGVRDVDMSGAVVGEGVINGPRVVHMAGDHVEDEAKIDGLERIVFNDEPTASQIEKPSRLEMNTAVEAGASYTAGVGKVSWDTLEDTLVVYVASGA